MKCNHEGCDRVANVSGGARGFCNKHYLRFKRHGCSHISKIDRESQHETCTIEGCQKPHVAKGLCDMHVQRLRKNGSPHKLHEKHRRRISWLENNSNYKGDDCLIWPFGVSDNGRGVVTVNGKTTTAPRAMCILAHGEPPTTKHHAAHICGRGHIGCVNPRHLSWKTAKENEADKALHGTLRKGSDINTNKLSEADVIEIRKKLYSGSSGVELAAQYNVTSSTISNIRLGKSWDWLGGNLP